MAKHISIGIPTFGGPGRGKGLARRPKGVGKIRSRRKTTLKRKV